MASADAVRRRREKNRRNAAAYRHRREQHVADLANELEKLREENDVLVSRVNAARHVLKLLRRPRTPTADGLGDAAV